MWDLAFGIFVIELGKFPIELADRGLEHRAMRSRAGLLQVRERARARERQRRALGFPRRFLRRHALLRYRGPIRGLLLRFDRLALPASRHPSIKSQRRRAE